jgi:chemotaxis regulatin CheY-phosphate phosphatase CheZ
MVESQRETNNADLLGRLDERTKAIQASIDKLNFDIRLQIDNLSKKIDDSEDRTNRKIDEIKKDIEENYVKVEQFSPIQKIVYGVVALILITVAGSILALVLAQPKLPITSTTGG